MYLAPALQLVKLSKQRTMNHNSGKLAASNFNPTRNNQNIYFCSRLEVSKACISFNLKSMHDFCISCYCYWQWNDIFDRTDSFLIWNGSIWVFQGLSFLLKYCSISYSHLTHHYISALNKKRLLRVMCGNDSLSSFSQR